MKTFHLTISRVNENLFDGTVLSVTLPGSEGVFEVLANHEPFVSELKSGEIKISSEGKALCIQIENGIAEVSNNQVTVLV